MNEDFVPFELAKKLVYKGFNAPCIAHYDEGFLRYNTKYPFALTAEELLISHNSRYTWVDAPTISQALKWLREEKIFISIVLSMCGYHYDVQYNIKNNSDYPDLLKWDNAILNGEQTIFASYEEAAIAGIEYCLDNLI